MKMSAEEITAEVLRQLMERAGEAAVKAGKKILEIYNSPFNVTWKEDNSPLTEADRQAHEIIDADLSSSNFPVLSEEGNNISFDERQLWNYYWLVDPLDGTREFINRNGEFTVNIALIKNNTPVAGIIYQPVTGILYAGFSAGHFYRLDMNKIFSVEFTPETIFTNNNDTSSSDIKRVIASRSHLDENTLAFIAETKMNSQVELVQAGSSLKFCLLAEGRADVYPRFAPTMEWDIAAGHAILKACGKNIFNYSEREEMKYNKPSLTNDWFIAR